MKKKYEKPGLLIEQFALAQTIAAGGCGSDIDSMAGSTTGKPCHADKFSCGWKLDEATILWVENSGSNCTWDTGTNEKVDGVCYNNPSPAIQIYTAS